MNPNLEAFFKQFGRVKGLPDDFNPGEAWKYGLETPDGQFDYQKYQEMVKYGLNPSLTNTPGVSPGGLKNPNAPYDPITNPYLPAGTVTDPNLPNWIRDQHTEQLRKMAKDMMSQQNTGTIPEPLAPPPPIPAPIARPQQPQLPQPQLQFQQPTSSAGGSRNPIPMSQFNLMQQVMGGGFANPYVIGVGNRGQQMNPYSMGGMQSFSGADSSFGMQNMWPQNLGDFGGMMKTPFAGGGGGYTGMPFYSNMQNPHPTWNPGFSWSQMPGLGYNFPMGYTPSYGFPRAHWSGIPQPITQITTSRATSPAVGLFTPAAPAFGGRR